MPNSDIAELAILSPDECLALLRNHPVHVGRLGVNDPAGWPMIVPVNYRLDGDVIVVRLEPGSLIARQARGRRVAFEVDDVDPAWQEGWSVLIQGDAVPVTEADDLARVRRLPLRPWAPGDHPLYLRIEPATVTGRRIV